jgi:hypothetical protein
MLLLRRRMWYQLAGLRSDFSRLAAALTQQPSSAAAPFRPDPSDGERFLNSESPPARTRCRGAAREVDAVSKPLPEAPIATANSTTSSSCEGKLEGEICAMGEEDGSPSAAVLLLLEKVSNSEGTGILKTQMTKGCPRGESCLPFHTSFVCRRAREIMSGATQIKTWNTLGVRGIGGQYLT